MNQVKKPSQDMTKDEYRKYLSKRIGQLMEVELRDKLRNSASMSSVSEEKFETKPYLLSKKLEMSRFLFGCRTGTTDQLAGNIYGGGGNTTCLCGSARETSAHVVDCPLYLICSEGLPEWRHDADQGIEYWLRLLRMRANLRASIPQTPLNSPVSDG